MSITHGSRIRMRVTSKGQVTIPKPIRDQLNIRDGSEVTFEEEDGRFFLKLEDNRRFWKERIRRTAGTMDAGMTTDEIMRLTRGHGLDDPGT